MTAASQVFLQYAAARPKFPFLMFSERLLSCSAVLRDAEQADLFDLL